MLGIMLPTWFLSMWMSNTATTAMMIPILNATLGQIKEVRNKGIHTADRLVATCVLVAREFSVLWTFLVLGKESVYVECDHVATVYKQVSP